MKKLKLKMQDLINPTILSHHEIKNIMGGSGVGGSSSCTCTWTKTDNTTSTSTCDDTVSNCQTSAQILCDAMTTCKSVTCK